MLHFPSSYTALPKRTDSLNATQRKSLLPSESLPILLKIEEELHDARRVHQHGQEDDLRMALNMVIKRVGELSSLLSETYKEKADLQVQLNVAKSNLQLVISNNEMLEEAIKSGNNAKDIGWRRSGDRASMDRNSNHSSVDIPTPSPAESNDGHSPSTPQTPQQPPQESRFFKFRFSGNNAPSSSSSSTPPSRTSTPPIQQQPHHHHLASSSMTSLHTPLHTQIEDLTNELEKVKAAKEAVVKEKKELEQELESLSQALFEEANKMVAQERIKRAETEEELKEAKQQKEALKSALRVVEGEIEVLRGRVGRLRSRSRSRSSSEVGLKSPPRTPSPPRSPSPLQEWNWKSHPLEAITPKPENVPLPESPERERERPTSSLGLGLGLDDTSPWADTISSSPLSSSLPLGGDPPAKSLKRSDSQSFYAAAYAMRMA